MDFLSPSSVCRTSIEALLDRAFGPDRLARTASRLREGADAIERACFVAVDREALVGSVTTSLVGWHGRGRILPLALVGPLAADPDRRGERIGSRLLDLALGEIDAMGLDAMVIGDAPYYGRWGFSAAHTGGWRLPGPVDPARLLLRARAPMRLSGAAVLRPLTGRAGAALLSAA